jgi:hypothetical protein
VQAIGAGNGEQRWNMPNVNIFFDMRVPELGVLPGKIYSEALAMADGASSSSPYAGLNDLDALKKSGIYQKPKSLHAQLS